MCREMKREPAWVAAIRLALLEGRVDVPSVVEEANLIPGRERTVRDVLSTMADRGLLEPVDEDVYVPGSVLLNSDRFDLDFDRASDGGAHRWKSSV
ncbi:hypothetical protein DU500_08515 [Haloplanus rubicundus]|jgi:hypothetical protein|uniref:MarR family transcriptional regulator n=1 Tax=Haloplanus rubicundus TaxID=1547898 RepID=A0A345E2N5_9EURY|nr:hypothetical protein [Haloplanus rubicundus]AXG06457.1 hypothetical protein DU500_08515 [Haloplanus rubicundus]